MKFFLGNLNDNEIKITKYFLELHGHSCSDDGLIIKKEIISENIIKIEYDGLKNIHISVCKDVQFYRGIHLLLQEMENKENKSFSKFEISRFSETGLLLDCSRNGTLCINMLKKFSDLCAACGINQLYLYMEDVYEISENEYFGAYRGKYTYEELKELDDYAHNMGIELIPAIQTLAHLHTYLKWPIAKSLQDTDDILLTESRETEEFIKAMIKSVTYPFSTNKIHIGMDEADFLGLGKYLKINGYKSRYDIMMKHLKMVYSICKEENLKVMMWGDMFFRLKSSTGDYYDLDENTIFDDIDDIPEDLTLVYWDYYHHETNIYEKNIKLHKKLTNNIFFAGGGWTWNGVSPNYSKARKTLENGLKSCSKENINNVLCTFWFDNGMETPAEALLYSAIYFSQLCYHDEVDSYQLDKWLKQLTGYSEKEFMLLNALDSPKGVLEDNKNADNPSKYLLYQDTLVGIFDGQIRNTYLDMYYKKLYENIDNILPKGTELDDIFYYYKTLAYVLSEKSMIGVRLREAYQNKEKTKLVLLKEQMTQCLDKIWELKELRKKIWFHECKPFGYEVLDIRLGGVWVRMKSSIQRIDDYLKGKSDYIDELNEKMIIYDEDKNNPNHIHCMGGFWQNIVSAANISGI